MNKIVAKFTEFTNKTNWVEGTVGPFNFQAKLFYEGSVFGIKEGRVSKLGIWDEKIRQEKMDFFKSCIVNYDRGWDIEPKKDNVQYFDAVMELLENSPKRFT